MKKLARLFLVFAKIGVCTFGGGLTMLPMLKYELCEKRGWTSEEELLDYYAVGQCTPGIIAVNTATFVGYSQAGVWGGIFATLGMIFPSIVIILLVAALLSGFMSRKVVSWALSGLRAGVCALLAGTSVTLVRKSVVDVFTGALYVAALAVALLTKTPSVVIVLLSAAAGMLRSLRRRPRREERATAGGEASSKEETSPGAVRSLKGQSLPERVTAPAGEPQKGQFSPERAAAPGEEPLMGQFSPNAEPTLDRQPSPGGVSSPTGEPSRDGEKPPPAGGASPKGEGPGE